MKTNINEIEINGEVYIKKSKVKTFDKPDGDLDKNSFNCGYISNCESNSDCEHMIKAV